MKKKTNRKSPSELVRDTASKKQPRNWFTELELNKQEYIYQVIEEMKKNPSVGILPVATAIRAELLIEASEQTITRKLKELLNEA